MPRRQKTEEEKALEQQVATFIKSIKGTDKLGPDVARALGLLERAAKYQAQALAILRGEEVKQSEPAPGKNRVGRPKNAADGADRDLFSADSQAPGEPAVVAPAKTSRSKKGAATAPATA